MDRFCHARGISHLRHLLGGLRPAAGGRQPTFRLTEIVRQSNEATKEAVYAALAADAAKALQAIERGGGEVVEIQGKSHAEDAHDRRAFLARRYAGLTPEERARTVLADPSRAGRQELNEQVREALQARGELQGPQLTLDILVPKGLTPGEQKQPVFYGRGDVVSFRRELAPRQQDRLEKDTLYRVAGIDQHGGRLQLQKDDGSFVIWRPGSCGARDAEVYRLEQRQLAAGDRITWTRNLPAIGVANGQMATVTAVHPAKGSFTVEQLAARPRWRPARPRPATSSMATRRRRRSCRARPPSGRCSMPSTGG